VRDRCQRESESEETCGGEMHVNVSINVSCRELRPILVYATLFYWVPMP